MWQTSICILVRTLEQLATCSLFTTDEFVCIGASICVAAVLVLLANAFNSSIGKLQISK